MRIALGIEYNGSAYCGWQHQGYVPAIQTALEKALSSVANEPVNLICAGRTDKGVHAMGQVAHFDTVAVRTSHQWLLGTNTNLPGDIRVRWAQVVDEAFHARYSAVARTYHYYILHDVVPPGVFQNLLTWERLPLNVEKMQEGANYLLGEHDFSAFRGSACQARRPFRNIQAIRFSQEGQLYCLTITANAFLLHMVRNIAGALLSVGRGDSAPTRIKAILESRDRRQGDVTAPPDGLYLARVHYPERYPFDCPPNLFLGARRGVGSADLE